MIAKFKFIVPALLLLNIFLSCSKERKFPPLNSKKTSLTNLTLDGSTAFPENEQTLESIPEKSFSVELNELKTFIEFYSDRNENFDLKTFERKWIEVQQQIIPANLNVEDLKTWIAINGFLIELTGKAEYAEEMERISLAESNSSLSGAKGEFEAMIAPYIFTRDVDNIFVNLFVNSTLEFEHSLFGAVKIEQETDYPKSGSVRIKFSLAEKKYMELNVRIPSWAQNATVTVKKVKYLATPGTYSKIAKQWKEGDEVEIEFLSIKTEAK